MNNASMDYVIALYVRLSIEDLKVDSLSIQSQLALLHSYADDMEGIPNAQVEEFIDNGHSGTNFERPAVQKLLDRVRAGEIHCILVKDFSRFGRNMIEVGYFMERVFPVFGVRFISVEDGFDSAQHQGDTGGIGMAVKYLISEFYSRDMSVKTRTAKYVKMKRGEYQSVVCPYGYQKGADGRMEIDEETAPNVRLIFQMALDGHDAHQIAEVLFQKGIVTPGEYKASKGKHYHDVSRCQGIWQRTTILRILGDERYAGTYIMGKRKVREIGGRCLHLKDESEWFKIPDHHPPIIDKSMYEQVQATLLHFKSVKKKVHQYPLRGKVFCGCCEHAMGRIPAKKPYFICRYTSVDSMSPCHGMRILEAELESLIYEILLKQAGIILNIDSLSVAGGLDVQLAEQTEYQNRIRQCQTEKRLLYERFLLKEIDKDSYLEQKSVCDKELNRLKQAHSALSAEISQKQMDSDTKSQLKSIASDISGADGLTETFANVLIERISVFPDSQIKIEWKMKDFCREIS